MSLRVQSATVLEFLFLFLVSSRKGRFTGENQRKAQGRILYVYEKKDKTKRVDHFGYNSCHVSVKLIVC